MSIKLFKQFIRKAVLKKRVGTVPGGGVNVSTSVGIGKQGAPGPAPRPGLRWKPQTHRWIRDEGTAQEMRMPRDTGVGWDRAQREKKKLYGDWGPSGQYNPRTSPLGVRENEIKDLFRDRALDALINGEIDVHGGDIESELIDQVFLNGDILGELGIVIPDDDATSDSANDHVADIINDATAEFMNREGTRELLTGSGVEGYDEW